MITYVDADWAGDKKGRRSTSGVIVTLNGCLVAWLSKLQATVARSTWQAELIAASAGAAITVHLRNLLAELGFKLGGPTSLRIEQPEDEGFEEQAERRLYPSIMLCDNQGSIAAANNQVTSTRLKHCEISDLWVREQIARGQIWMHYIPTQENPADCCTKALGPIKHRQFISMYYKVS